MPTYLVRLKSNQELVGLFVSPRETDLAEFVDECTDPFACEYVELPPGGIFLPNAGAPRVPTVVPDPEVDEAHPDWFSGGVLSELWIAHFYNEWTQCEQLVPHEGFIEGREI